MLTGCHFLIHPHTHTTHIRTIPTHTHPNTPHPHTPPTPILHPHPSTPPTPTYSTHTHIFHPHSHTHTHTHTHTYSTHTHIFHPHTFTRTRTLLHRCVPQTVILVRLVRLSIPSCLATWISLTSRWTLDGWRRQRNWTMRRSPAIPSASGPRTSGPTQSECMCPCSSWYRRVAGCTTV